MSRRTPIVVRLPLAFARGRLSMAQVLSRAVSGDVRREVGAFRLHPRELRFARSLLEDHTRIWVYRSHQQARAGDFALVDMSSPDPGHREVWVVDLKLHRPVRFGGGGAGIQLSRHGLAIDELRRAGVIGRTTCAVLATGGAQQIIEAMVKRARQASLSG